MDDSASLSTQLDCDTLRDAPPVAAQAVVWPRAWRMVQSQDGCLQLLCLLPDRDTFRVTTPIAAVSFPERCMVTASGRSYRLSSPPTAIPMLIAAMLDHANLNDVTVVSDVSDLVWAEMLHAAH